MSPPLPPSDAGDPPSGSSGRRRFLRLALGLTAGAAVGGRLLHEVVRSSDPPAEEPVTILESCLGCTGCAILCPTGAIAVVAGGIMVSRDRCTRCGYCVAGCPVAGLRVNPARGGR